MAERAQADLHVHTSVSDGDFPPAEVVRLAAEAGLQAIAVTDHDTLDGFSEAAEAGRRWGVEVVPGVEISTSSDGKDIHVLGYFVDVSDARFRERLAYQRDARRRRNERMAERLRELGVPVALEEIEEEARRSGKPNRHIGRAHIADWLVRNGYAESRADAFRRWLGREGAAYVALSRIAPEEAIRWIHEAGGAAVLAHPGLYGVPDLVDRLAAFGLDGVEAYHSDHDADQEAFYAAAAERLGLVATAGSDFHGRRGGDFFHGPVGNRRISRDVLEHLKERTKRST
ncbi:MAG: phosphatase [Candidatus Reconcilbacillus cellulovorans]|uniref:Phosphatase n=1 Tax=Candidatus Reconcilbacillus cellulovorans TaxID=1906605 RepID=A0A2A6E454_9BACL|nr:MAG: phosphatase [Candidatus Reconcilbacillus cellulovorans]